MSMTATVVGVFAVVYLGMILGRLPFIQLDRTGVALLGAIALVGLGAVSLEEAVESIHLPTLLLLFSFMVVSAQLRLGGFYGAVTRWIVRLPLTPAALLGALIVLVAVLSAVFSNDIVCLTVAPVLIEACRGRGLKPIPFLLALCCAANIGSAATLIGNPQNMLIGETLHLSFAGYLLDAFLPVTLALIATWLILLTLTQGKLENINGTLDVGTLDPDARPQIDVWQTYKGLSVTAAIVVCFLCTEWPREVVALVGAGALLTSRRLHSREMLGLVDWQLLILFVGLFVVNQALQKTGAPEEAVGQLAALGVHVQSLGPLFLTTFVLSNVVSNVPAVMLLLPVVDPSSSPGPTLALVSTFAGNLLIVGSVANIIVVDAASRSGVAIDWRQHARVGVPVTLATLAIIAVFLSLGWIGSR